MSDPIDLLVERNRALDRAERAEARVKNLEGAARECLSLIDKDASGHARPTVKAMFAVQSVLKRVLRGEEER